eukprot:PITA_08389
MNSIRLVLFLAAYFKWEVHHMDVKFVFLYGDLHEEIYMEQPPSFIQTDSNIVCRLKKSFYSLKQAPRAWYAKMDKFLLDIGFSRCHSNNTVYTKKVGKSLIILVLYVDDLILTGSYPKLINHEKSILKNKFEMTDLGHLHYFLGLQVLQSKEGISLSQSKYSCDLLRHFHMEDCKPTPSPFQSGAKISVTCTSPEVNATLYQASPLLVGFADSDWVVDHDDRKSTAGYVFTLGFGPITRACKKQSVISLFSAEVEYRGVVEASKEAMWLHQILSNFGFQ